MLDFVHAINVIALILGYLMLGPVVLGIAWALGLWTEQLQKAWSYRRRRNQEMRALRDQNWKLRLEDRRICEENEYLIERNRMHDTVRLDETLEQEIYTYLEGNKA